MKTTLFSFLFLVTLTLSAQAQRYICGLSGTITRNGVQSLPEIISPVKLTKRDLLTTVSNTVGRSLNPAALQLVYDTAAKQFQVVQRADGALVAVIYTVANEREIVAHDESTLASFYGSTKVLRQADLLEPGTTAAVGTVAGLLTQAVLIDSHYTPTQIFAWNAKFSVLSQTSGVFLQKQFPLPPAGSPVLYTSTPALIEGQFTVHGAPFVPSGK